MWINTEAGQRYCDVHDQTFGKTSTCTACDGDPGVAPSEQIAELPDPPPGCFRTVEHERCLISAIEDVDNLIERVLPPDDDDETFRITDTHLINAIAKLFDVRVKLRRAAAELATAREDAELVAARDKLFNRREKGSAH